MSLRLGASMCVAAAALLLFGAPSTAAAADPDPPAAAAPTLYEAGRTWFSRDKAYHFAGSAVGSAAVYAAARELGLGRVGAAATAAVLAGTVGVLREIVAVDDPTNRLTRARFSRRDMVWNSVGIVIGISLTDLFGYSQ